MNILYKNRNHTCKCKLGSKHHNCKYVITEYKRRIIILYKSAKELDIAYYTKMNNEKE